MECHPEEDDHCEDEEESNETAVSISFLLRCLLVCNGFLSDSLLVFCFLGRVVYRGESPAEAIVDGDGDEQRHAGHTKRIVIGRSLRSVERVHSPLMELHGSRRSEEGSDVDGHIEDRETIVALGSVAGIVIELTDHHLQVALEERRADRDQQQSGGHHRNGGHAIASRYGEQQIADEHDEDTKRHTAAEADLVCHGTTNDRQEIDEHEERRVDRTGQALAPSEVCLQEEHEDGQHRVVAKTLSCVGQS